LLGDDLVRAAALRNRDGDLPSRPTHLAHDRAEGDVRVAGVERAGQCAQQRCVALLRPKGCGVCCAAAAPFIERAECADA
jgi:hypothetical protein